jgi:hypothetical protein
MNEWKFLMTEEDLWTPNRHDEVVTDDLWTLCELIESYVTRRGGTMDVKSRRLMRLLTGYILLAQKGDLMGIVLRRRPYVPFGWNAHAERLWRDWIAYTYDLESWEREVITPLFGSDVRFWEARLGAWRTDLFGFLGQLIQRNMDVVTEFDPRSEEEDEEDGPRGDPYLLEHGKRRR